MDSVTIDSVLKRNCPIYRGVYAADKLPSIIIRPCVIVVNTDPASQPGQHWICIYFDDYGYGEFFDSLGIHPKRSFERYLNNNCIDWNFNDKQLQSLVSRFCGHYCIYYCILKSRRVSLIEIIQAMTGDTGLNDYLIHRFVCNLL